MPLTNKKYPHLYDLIASILTVAILLLSSQLERGGIRIITLFGLLFLAVACLLWILALVHLKRYGDVEKGTNYYDTKQVVNKGIYTLVRHPQYLAYIYLVAGFALMSQHWLIFLFSLLAILFFIKHTRYEENELMDKFKESFQTYCHDVPRLNIVVGMIRYIKRKKWTGKG